MKMTDKEQKINNKESNKICMICGDKAVGIIEFFLFFIVLITIINKVKFNKIRL